MNLDEHLLTCLAEEANEVAHACAKALRFGVSHAPQGKVLSNAQFILSEVDDLRAVVELLQACGVLPVDMERVSRLRIQMKKQRVLNHLEVATAQGCLQFEEKDRAELVRGSA